jgi:hypothetical protein
MNTTHLRKTRQVNGSKGYRVAQIKKKLAARRARKAELAYYQAQQDTARAATALAATAL